MQRSRIKSSRPTARLKTAGDDFILVAAPVCAASPTGSSPVRHTNEPRRRATPSLTSVASPLCFSSVNMRRLCDLCRMLLGVLAHPPSEQLDRHDAERRMPTLARPVSVGQCLEQPCELLVLGDDRV